LGSYLILLTSSNLIFFEDFRIKEHSVLVFKKKIRIKNIWFWQNPQRINGCHERTSKEPIGL
jgi:hypothetical protein